MIKKLVGSIFLSFASISICGAQDVPSVSELVHGMNLAIGSEVDGTLAYRKAMPSELPQWGVVVKNSAGETVDAFGQVPYVVSPAGVIDIPGFNRQEGTYLELIPGTEYVATGAIAGVDPKYAPITEIPNAVGDATDYLATSLCNLKGRPTEITLSLVVGASGNILFAEASTEAGSEVMWNFPNDICPRYGITTPGAQ